MLVHLQQSHVWDHIDEAAVDVLAGVQSVEPVLQNSESKDDNSMRRMKVVQVQSRLRHGQRYPGPCQPGNWLSTQPAG